MFSILDILKKQREEKRKSEPVPAGASPSAPPVQAEPLSVVPVPPESAPENLSIFSAVTKEVDDEEARQMSRFYDSAIAVAKKVYVADGPTAAVLANELAPVITGLVGTISKGNKEALRFFFADYPDPVNYLYYHAVNVCILSIELGLQLQYASAALEDLATAAFLHDIGMTSVHELIAKSGKLAGEEMDRMRQHTRKGAEILDRVARDFPHSVTEAVLNEHERFDGSGYPKGLKAEEIPELAQLVGLADVYEAIVHFRPYRQRQSPSDTINAILSNKGAFSARVTKALLERIGVYPAGTRVRLNTKELAVVMCVNPGSPLRPVVAVIADAQGNPLTALKEINLLKNYLVYIEECLDIPRPV